MRGDPLPPRLIVPAPIADLSAERFGDRVYVQLTIPSADSDGAEPADLGRVDVYARTALPSDDGTDLAFDDWLDAATLVARLEVARPAGDAAGNDETVGRGALPAQGARVTVVEELTLAALAPAAIGEDNDSAEMR
ncbi:MAG: hypothetical protein OXQ28_04700, partial [Acidobacteriota bacterium]|nr:hypothetical protein [Acidobacteriota bacterium]